MRKKERSWKILIIGGASCTGKSSIAYEIANYYGISVLEFDDIYIALQTVVSADRFPAICDINGDNWESLGVEGNFNWLTEVAREMSEALIKIVERHIEDDVPVIIEGDYILPELVEPLLSDNVKAFFVQEADKSQIMNNNQAREGWSNSVSADIYVYYNNWIRKSCEELMINTLESRPWNNVLTRAIELLDE